jgi:hypothetical protein
LYYLLPSLFLVLSNSLPNSFSMLFTFGSPYLPFSQFYSHSSIPCSLLLSPPTLSSFLFLSNAAIQAMLNLQIYSISRFRSSPRVKRSRVGGREKHKSPSEQN